MILFCLIGVWFWASLAAFSQENACSDQLKQAELTFETGRYQEIPSLLSGCPDEKAMNREQRLRAAELLAHAYRLSRDYERADSLYVKILQINPCYPQESLDPELRHFTSLYKSWHITGGSSMGLQFAPVSFIRRYDAAGVLTTSQHAGLSGLAYLTVWAGFDFFKPDNFELVTEFKNAPTQHFYSSALEVQMPDAPPQNANLNFEEFTMWLELNLLANYHFPIKKLSFGDRVSYYAQFGGGYTWMKESRLENIVLDPAWASEKTRLDALVITREGESLRRMDNYAVHAGLGLTYRISHFLSIYGQARYTLRLRNLVNEQNRSANATLTNDFYYLDDDMLMHGISLSAGIRLTHFFNWKHK